MVIKIVILNIILFIIWYKKMKWYIWKTNFHYNKYKDYSSNRLNSNNWLIWLNSRIFYSKFPNANPLIPKQLLFGVVQEVVGQGLHKIAEKLV